MELPYGLQFYQYEPTASISKGKSVPNEERKGGKCTCKCCSNSEDTLCCQEDQDFNELFMELSVSQDGEGNCITDMKTFHDLMINFFYFDINIYWYVIYLFEKLMTKEPCTGNSRSF